MSNIYSTANELESAALAMIRADHLRHLDGVTIKYVWRSTPVRRRDQLDFGRVSKVAGLGAYLALARIDEPFELTASSPPTSFFVVEVYRQGWDLLNDQQRMKLLDHLLSSLRAKEVASASGEVSIHLSICAPDVVEFSSVRARFPDVEFNGLLAKAVVDQEAGKPETVIGVNGKPRQGKGKRKRKSYDTPRPTTSTERRVIGETTYTLAVTPDGSEYQFMIAVRGPGDEDRICVAGRRAETIDAAKQFFEEYVAEQA